MYGGTPDVQPDTFGSNHKAAADPDAFRTERRLTIGASRINDERFSCSMGPPVESLIAVRGPMAPWSTHFFSKARTLAAN